MAKKSKYYVVWEGLHTGIIDSWDECQEYVTGYPNAKYKAFNTKDEAVEAYRKYPDTDIIRSIAQHQAQAPAPKTEPSQKPAPRVLPPGVVLDAIAVDAGCSKNPGPVEYQGVWVPTGQRLFHAGPYPGGTNNIGEYLAIIHAAAMLMQQGNRHTAIYTDSRTALAWIRNRHSKTTLQPTPQNAQIHQLLQRGDAWMARNTIANPIIKWDTERWGEIPADFGRK